jgi:hypothetical protein
MHSCCWLLLLLLLQTAVIHLSLKRKRRIQDGYFDEICNFTATETMPPGNFFPRSYYLMKKVVGVKEARDVQVCAVKSAAGMLGLQLCLVLLWQVYVTGGWQHVATTQQFWFSFPAAAAHM